MPNKIDNTGCIKITIVGQLTYGSDNRAKVCNSGDNLSSVPTQVSHEIRKQLRFRGSRERTN